MADVMTKPGALDDAIEAAVMQNEDRLDDVVMRSKAGGGSPEGPRFPIYLDVNGEKVEIIDVSPEEKAAASTIAVQARAAKAEAETLRYAKFKLGQMSEVEAIDFIRGLADGERTPYFVAERAGQNRPAIFDIFGEKPGPTAPKATKKEDK